MARLSAARKLAVQVGAAVRLRDAFAGDVLDAMLAKQDLPESERAFARVLSLGVTATWGTLDEVIDRCLNAPTDVKPNVRDALRVTAYELVFLRKDAYAAVDQGVALVASVERRATNLANAVLRRVARAAEQFPFGDPATDDAALARGFGFPRWLARTLIDQLGRERAAAFMKASNEPPPMYVAVNAIKARHDDVARQLQAAGSSVRPVPASAFGIGGAGNVPGCLHVEDPLVLRTRTARRLFQEGAMLASDAAAQHIAALALPPDHPAGFLEIGAGRGTKTILLQSGAVRKWGRQMSLTAVDQQDFKAGVLQRHAATYGAELARLVTCDARNLTPPFGKRTFDAALVDAPCSGLGTLRRHPEIRWRLTPGHVNELADAQLALLSEAARHVAPGGQLTYSTCTVLVQENEYVVRRLMERDEGKAFRIKPYAQDAQGKPVLFFRSALASGTPDAHFAARLVRVG